MAGRRPKPNHLHVVSGTGRADRHALGNGPQPSPLNIVPEPPEHMAPVAADYWRSLAPVLHRMGVLTEADTTALERLCQCYAEIRRCETVLEIMGHIYEASTPGGATMVRARPEVAQLADADRRFKSYLVEFGLTPAARTKVKVDNGAKATDPAARFFG